MVVTRVELRTIGGESVKPRGSAGRVVHAPRDATHNYRVSFPNGDEVVAKRTELAVLKHFQNIGFEETGEVLEEYDLWDHVVYRCITGSRAYGLSREGSDVDRRGVYLPPADLHWSLFGVPEQLENGDTEECYWEVQKFLTLALKANPNILECLWSPLVEHVDEVGRDIIEHREIFLSQLVYQTYNRYVMSQFKKLTRRIERGDDINWKHAMHLVRLLMAGITILREGRVPVDVGELDAELVAGEDPREFLLEIRDGACRWEELDRMRLRLHDEMDAAFGCTKLPERPDYSEANALLLRARRFALNPSSPPKG